MKARVWNRETGNVSEINGCANDIIKEFQKICLPDIAKMPVEEYIAFFNKAHGIADENRISNPNLVIENLKAVGWVDIVE